MPINHQAYHAFKQKVIESKTKLKEYRDTHYGLNESSNIDDGISSYNQTLEQINILLLRMEDAILYMDRAMLPEDNINYVDASESFRIFDENFIVVEYIIDQLLAGNPVLDFDLQTAINHMINIEQDDGIIEAVLDILHPNVAEEEVDLASIEEGNNPYLYYMLNASNYNIDELFYVPKIGSTSKSNSINNNLIEIFDFSPSAFKAEYAENCDFVDQKLDVFILLDSAFYCQQ